MQVIKEIDFISNTTIDNITIVYHPNSNCIEVALFKDNHYVESVWLNNIQFYGTYAPVVE